MNHMCVIHPLYDEPCPVCKLHEKAVEEAGYSGMARFLKESKKTDPNQVAHFYQK